jgi:site-specific recombinase XerD
MTEEETVELFKSYLQGRKSEHTIRAYGSTLANFLRFAQQQEPNKMLVENFLILQKKTVNTKTLNRHIFALRSWFKSIGKEDELKNVETFMPTDKKQKVVPIEKLKLLLNHCSTPIQKLLITVLIVTGARIGEIALLKKTDFKKVNEKLMLIHLATSKKRKRDVTRDFPVKADWAIKIIEEALTTITTDNVFGEANVDNLRYMVKIVGVAGGLPKLHPHQFRHALITELGINKHMDVKIISTLIGHSSVVITEGYLHVETENLIDNMPDDL